MGQVFSNCIKLWFGLDNRKPNGLRDLLISPPKLDFCNDSHSEPFTESSTDCVINIDSSIQILNEEFKSFPDLDSVEEDKSCAIHIDSSIQPVDNDYKSFLDLDKEEILEGCLLCEDKTISHANSYTGSSTHFVTNEDSSIPVVEKEYKCSPVLNIGEAKAGPIFGEDESKASDLWRKSTNLLISSLTFGSCNDSHKNPRRESSIQVVVPDLDSGEEHKSCVINIDSSIQAVDSDYKSFLDLDKEEILEGCLLCEDKTIPHANSYTGSSTHFVTKEDSSIPVVEKEYKCSPVLKIGEAKAGPIFGEDESKASDLWIKSTNLLISSLTFGSCNDSHKKPRRESSIRVVVPDLDSGEEDKSCVIINIDSSIQAVDSDYKSFLDLDKGKILEGCLLCEDKTIPHANSYTGSSTHFVTTKDSSIPVVEKEDKSWPVLKTGEAKAGLIFGKDESKANEQNLLISSPTFFTNKNSSIPVVDKEYKSSPVLKTGGEKAGLVFGADETKANEQNLLVSSLTFFTNKDSSIPVAEKEYKSSPVLKREEAKAGLVFGEDEGKANEQNLLISSLTFDSCNDSHKKPRRRKVKICKENTVVVKERCIKQYCSSHKILLVGEEDFSISASLAMAFGSASNMIATSLDSEGLLRKNYKRAMSNIQELKNRGCLVMNGVDVTQMADYYFLQGMRFDRIIYNFPLAGFFKDESRKSQLKQNRKLVRLFFINAKKMICEKGEIHIAHKSRGFFLEGTSKSLAGTVGLRLIEELPFNYKDFAGYCTKYGLRSSSQVEVPEFDTGGTEEEVINEVKVCKEVVVVKEKWIKQYCSSHKILLVGDGDFSFSASLAVAFGSASNMIATSLDSEGFFRENYKRAMPNIQDLKNRGCFVMHGIDATEMADHYFLRGMRFDRIIYNFPLAGFFKDESRKSQLKWNRKLVRLFFMNAKKMISENGEIHIAHKSWGFFLDWNLKSLAGTVGLRLINELSFNVKDFSGYCTKYGFGGDNNFNNNHSKRYIFGL